MPEQEPQDEIGRQLAILGERIDVLLTGVPAERDDGHVTQRAQRQDVRGFTYEISKSVYPNHDVVHHLKIILPADASESHKSWDYHWGGIIERGVDYVCLRQPGRGAPPEEVERLSNDIAAFDASDTIAGYLDRYSQIGQQPRLGDDT